jgi:hypothetical protein
MASCAAGFLFGDPEKPQRRFHFTHGFALSIASSDGELAFQAIVKPVLGRRSGYTFTPKVST